MQALGTLLALAAGIVGLVCFILVVVKMFQAGNTGLGIACIVLVFCFGIGGIVAFVMGWVKAREWNTRQIMLIWTGAIVVSLIGNILAPPDFSQFQNLPQPGNP